MQIDDLFAKTLIGDYHDEAPWEAVAKLRSIGTRPVFDRAAEWCTSNEPLKRARGADVLAQIGKTVEHPQNGFPDESYSLVSQLAEREKELLPLSASIFALGHIGNALAIPLVIEKRSHEDPNVRHAVACSLGNFANDVRAAQTLMALMRDADEDVRDWATFGLGVLGDVDSTEIREALLDRLTDSNRDVREEALAGLANRNELRAIPALIAELEQPDISDRLRDAAELFLGENEQRVEWTSEDYVAVLRKRVSL